MTDTLRVQVSSDVDYERLVAELYIKDRLVGYLTNEPSENMRFVFSKTCLGEGFPLSELLRGFALVEKELSKDQDQPAS